MAGRTSTKNTTEKIEIKPVEKKEVTTKIVTPVENSTNIKSIIQEAVKTTASEISKANEIKSEIKFTEDTMVTIKNNTCGELIYINNKTGDIYRWNQHGDTCDIKIADLREMKNSQRTFYTKNKFSVIGCVDNEDIEPEEIINYIGIGQYFKADLSPDLYEVINSWSDDKIKEKIPNISISCKQNLIVMLSTMIENEEIDSIRKIRAFETALNTKFND